jgi:hypothetical protein
MPLWPATGFYLEGARNALQALLELVHVLGACVLLGTALGTADVATIAGARRAMFCAPFDHPADFV